MGKARAHQLSPISVKADPGFQAAPGRPGAPLGAIPSLSPSSAPGVSASSHALVVPPSDLLLSHTHAPDSLLAPSSYSHLHAAFLPPLIQASNARSHRSFLIDGVHHLPASELTVSLCAMRDIQTPAWTLDTWLLILGLCMCCLLCPGYSWHAGSFSARGGLSSQGLPQPPLSHTHVTLHPWTQQDPHC